MKKQILLFSFVVLTLMGWAQKPSLNKAYNAFSNGEYLEAKGLIDQCLEDPKLNTKANTYLYKGNIYLYLANQEYEKLLAEISGEQRELLEKYMDIVDHAHFQEEQRAYYQGMIDTIQIFEGLGILKKRNKVKELLMHTEK